MDILVVDDNQDGALTTARALTLLGHEVRTAFNGATAVREAMLRHPQVVLLDIGMSGIDGYETCRVLRKMLADRVRIIAITGLESEEAQEKAREAGFDAYLMKPLNWKTLKQLLLQHQGS
jgi:CheY-like chemotaxis protein